MSWTRPVVLQCDNHLERPFFFVSDTPSIPLARANASKNGWGYVPANSSGSDPSDVDICPLSNG